MAVAMVTSKGNWLAKPKEMAHFGLESVASAEPGFELMVTKFKKRLANPQFCTGWEKKLAKRGKGVVVVRRMQFGMRLIGRGFLTKKCSLDLLPMCGPSHPRRMEHLPSSRTANCFPTCYQKPKELDKLLAQ